MSELKRRFRKYTDPSDPESEPLFLMSMMLDPRYKVLLNRNQADSTKLQLLKQLTESAQSRGNSNSPTSATLTQSPDEVEPPATKRFRHLSKLLEEKSSKKVDKSPPVKLELEHYVNIQPQYAEEADVMQFLIDAKEYPVLSSMALDILTIPASSTPVERVFSVAGESTSGKRNRLADQNLEREILVRKMDLIIRDQSKLVLDSLVPRPSCAFSMLHAEKSGRPGYEARFLTPICFLKLSNLL